MGASASKIDSAAPALPQSGFSNYPASDNGSFATTDGTAEAKVYFAETGPASEAGCAPMTIIETFKQAVEKQGDKNALLIERQEDGSPPPIGTAALPLSEWKTWTYKQYYDECRAAAKSLLALGVEQHDAVTIFGYNSPEWLIAEVAGIFAGAKAAGIYPTDTAEQVEFKARHSGASVAFMEDQGKLDKFTLAAANLPKLKAIVCWACTPGASVAGPNGPIPCYTWEAFMKLGADTDDKALDDRQALIKPGHCAALIYTSGTTGNPKAVMISHDNILFESVMVLDLLGDIFNEACEERILSFLPLSHVAGMMVDIICPLVMTARRPGWTALHFARPYDLKKGTIGDRLRMVKPTMFLGVPRVWEKVAEKVKAIGAAKPQFVRNISGWCKGKLLTHQNNCQLGGTGEPIFGHTIANAVLGKVKVALGLEKCKFGFTGAAPITKDTLEYFGSLGIQVNEVYGMSECTGATTWSLDRAHVWGSCGFTMPGTEVRIFACENGDINKKTECPRSADMFNASEAEQGEICFRGRHIMMGYLANPDLGAEHVAQIQGKLDAAIDNEGWLHSGDKGTMDERGMVKITGRYKELIIGAGGENVAPVPIEDNIKRLCPALSNVLMIGDKRKYNVALISLKAVGATGELPGSDDLDGAAKSVNPDVATISAAANDPAWQKYIADAIKATNADGSCCPSNASRVQKFTILPYDFSVQGGELTPTLKTKRSVVNKKFAAAIEAMYAPEVLKQDYVAFVGGNEAQA